MKCCNKKTLLITGISGALASRLCEFYKERYNIVGFHRDEHKSSKIPEYTSSEIGCVRDYNRVDQLFNKYRPNIVIHTGSLKKVDDIQLSPMEAVKTNILGTDNVCRACDKYKVERAVFTNTDKAGGGARS